MKKKAETPIPSPVLEVGKQIKVLDSTNYQTAEHLQQAIQKIVNDGWTLTATVTHNVVFFK